MSILKSQSRNRSINKRNQIIKIVTTLFRMQKEFQFASQNEKKSLKTSFNFELIKLKHSHTHTPRQIHIVLYIIHKIHLQSM